MSTPPPDPIHALRDDFRRCLETFYASLKLAPPYHSVEQAIAHLTSALKALEPAERERVAADPARRWELYRRAFIESGLSQKHRGIIAGLVRSRQTGDLPPDYQPFLDAFVS
ncbi:hypothetical protein [Nitrospira sp. Kam-Ns4a]